MFSNAATRQISMNNSDALLDIPGICSPIISRHLFSCISHALYEDLVYTLRMYLMLFTSRSHKDALKQKSFLPKLRLFVRLIKKPRW